MRTVDFAPLYRATVGFDRIADLMDRVLTNEVTQPTYPPYNIEKTAEDAYRISIAVAGFTPEELNVEVKDGTLLVAARKGDDAEGKTYLHRGIATRVVAQDPENPEYGTIELVFTNDPVALSSWVITDDMGNKTDVILERMILGGDLPPSLFNITLEQQKRGS